MCSIFEKIVGSPPVLRLASFYLRDSSTKRPVTRSSTSCAAVSPNQNLGTVEDGLNRDSPVDLQRFALTGKSELPPADPVGV